MESGQPHFGVWLRETRKRRGMTQESLAEASGESQSQISATENGADSYSERFVISIAEALGEDECAALKLAGCIKPKAEEQSALDDAIRARFKRLKPEQQKFVQTTIDALAAENEAGGLRGGRKQ